MVTVLSLFIGAWLCAVCWGVYVLVGKSLTRSYVGSPVHHRTEAEAKEYLKQAEQELAQMPDVSNNSSRTDLMTISSELGEIARDYPEMPEVWTISGKAINKNLGAAAAAHSPDCGSDAATASQTGTPKLSQNGVFAKYRDCTLTLGDQPGIESSDHASAPVRSTTGLLQLQNVHVIYRGGRLPPMETFACVHCTFDVELKGPPPKEGQSLVRGVLTLGSDNFAINL